MWFIGFSKSNCENCYACVRACPVHAIKVINKQSQIIKQRCIVCGKCLSRCPQNYKFIKSEKEMAKHFIRGKSKVIASISPNFASIFGKDSNKVPTALKMLGFDYVEEVSSYSKKIVDEYEKYANKDDDKTYITSACTSVNSLIEKYYKCLVPNIIEVISPQVYHGKILKKIYGEDTKVVYIGPCLGKKLESHDKESIDIVLTFEELIKWLNEESINLDSIEESEFDYISKKDRLIPITSSLTDCIENKNTKKSIIKVDGIKDCIKVLDEIKKGKFKNTLIEMSSCRYGCVGGSGMPIDGVTTYERKENLKQYATYCNQNEVYKEFEEDNVLESVATYKAYRAKEVLLKIPDEDRLEEILRTMGKNNIKDELNCGSCGYSTCREKAIAVYNEMAEVNMCLPFMREKAEDLKNIIFDMTPNIVAIINKELEIVQLNPSAQELFNVSGNRASGVPIDIFADEEKFKQVKETKINIVKEKSKIERYNKTVIQSIIWLEKNQLILWIADDITKDEELQKKIQNIKIDALTMAQRVIDKQMIVAQEIASLLGETTAETKVTLTQLKNLIKEDEVDV